jgi:hypothetical protein
MKTPTLDALEDPGLGLFARLPREIRDLIWTEFLPRNRVYETDRENNLTRNTDLAILRISYTIYREVGSMIYPNKGTPLIIIISPTYKYGSWITISNGKETPSLWHVRNLEYATQSGFLNLPVTSDGLKIEIEAPGQDDPGQFIVLSEKVQDVVDMVRRSANARLQIFLKDGGNGKWFNEKGKPTTTKLGRWQTQKSPSDYQLIVLSFLQLRDIRTCTVKIPDHVDLETPDIKKVFRKLQRKMKLFHRESRTGSQWLDDRTRSKFASHLNRCDGALNQLVGQTAIILRHRRFVRRFSEQMRLLKHLEDRVKDILVEGKVQGEGWHLPDERGYEALTKSLCDFAREIRLAFPRELIYPPYYGDDSGDDTSDSW